MVSGAASRVVYAADGTNRGSATVGVVVTGETPYSEGCGDIPTPANCPSGGTPRPTTLDLPSADVSKLMAYKSAGLKTVLVLVVGRPMIIRTRRAGRRRHHRRVATGQRGRRRRRRPVRRLQADGQAAAQLAAHPSQIPINMGDATYDPLFPYGLGLTY